jgi:5-methylcytosine-specific restriction endonuclease McrA
MTQLISCSRCGKVHPRGQCSKPPAPRRYHTRTDPAGSFRNTAAWQRKREEIKERDLHLCKLCLSNGKVTSRTLEVHHIIPVNTDDKLRLDDDNLITLCSSCHALVEGNSELVPTLRRLAVKSPRQILAENGK